VLLALIWLIGASAFLLVLWGSKLTFLLDDWEFLLYRRGFTESAILDPHGEHIVVAPVLIYKALLGIFGMGSALPFRAVALGFFFTSAVLLFVYLCQRVGQWPALAATAVVLFLGAAWEDLLWPFQVGYFGSMATGLGALLVLQRDDRRSDLIATALLSVSMLFSSLGLPFAIGVAVGVLTREDRWRRAYVFGLPIAVFGLWWLGWGHTAESHLTLTNAAKAPLFVLDSIAASIASLLGLATPSLDLGSGGLEWGRPLAVAAIGLAAWRIYKMPKVPRQLWVVLAIAGSFWILAGFNQIAGREPTASRYQYVGVVFLLLVGAELLRGVRIEPRAVRGAAILLAAVTLASIASNVYYLNKAWADGYHPISVLEKASLGAVEIARDTVEPGFVLEEDMAGTGYVHVEAGAYLSARDEFGSPAYSPDEIAASRGISRLAADRVLFGALRVEPKPVPSPAGAPASAPAAQADGSIAVPAGRCIEVPSDGAASPRLELPPGGVVVGAEDDPIEAIDMGRFALGPGWPIELDDDVVPGEAVELAIPEDRSTYPWMMELETAGPATVCGR
jgi:hypothetical protein